MKIRPLDDRVIIKPQESEERTSAGLYLPDGAREKPMHGKVVAVGPGKLNDDDERTAMQVKAGQTVVYGKYAGTEVEIDGVDHVIVKESELLATLD